MLHLCILIDVSHIELILIFSPFILQFEILFEIGVKKWESNKSWRINITYTALVVLVYTKYLSGISSINNFVIALHLIYFAGWGSGEREKVFLYFLWPGFHQKIWYGETHKKAHWRKTLPVWYLCKEVCTSWVISCSHERTHWRDAL